MVNHGPGRMRQGNEGRELHCSYELEGSQKSGRDGMKHGRTLGENIKLYHLIMADKVWLEAAI